MGAVGFEPTNPKERSYSPSRLARLRYTPISQTTILSYHIYDTLATPSFIKISPLPL